jgi:hypothetical protein
LSTSAQLVQAWIYFFTWLSFCSIDLSISLRATQLWLTGFMINLDVRPFFPLICYFSMLFLPCLLHCMWLLDNVTTFAKNICWNFDWECIRSQGQFRKN